MPGEYEQGFLEALLVAKELAEKSENLKDFLKKLRYFIELAKDEKFEHV